MKYIKLFESWKNTQDMNSWAEKLKERLSSAKDVTEAEAFLTKELDSTKDLRVIDAIGSVIEGIGLYHSEKKNLYVKFHRELVPAWIKKHWGNGMEYSIGYTDNDIFDLLYKNYGKKFEKYLDDKGLTCQECFVSYEPGLDPEGEYLSDCGNFTMGFDVWEKEKEGEEPKSGFAVFKFSVLDYVGFKITDVASIDKLDRFDKFAGESNCYIELGNGMFYTKKLDNIGFHKTPGLAEYLSDGAYTLRLD